MSDRQGRGVKALIFAGDGRILMQQRDDKPGLPFPGSWTFFGGLAEESESLGQALERELLEELGSIPGTVGPELFQWQSRRDWAPVRNHIFPVGPETLVKDLVLGEGQAMAWLSIADLVKLPLTPVVYENFAQICGFMSQYQADIATSLEEALLAFNVLDKKNDRIFYARENPCCLSRQQMFLLKALAEMRNVQVFRVCLHTDDQCDIHEMLMVHTVAGAVGPLKQNKTSLSYHVLEGALTVTQHDEAGLAFRDYLLGESPSSEPRNLSLRLKASEYRTIRSTSQFSIFLEVASGPFQDSDTIWLNPERRMESK
jgi:8-oxo-dGTP diphosphatase